MDLTFSLIIAFLAGGLVTVMSAKMFNIYQLSSYKVSGVFKWLKKTRFNYVVRYFSAAFLCFITMFAFICCFNRYEYISYIGFLCFIFFAVMFIVIDARESKKTPLVMTPRIARFSTVTFLINFVAAFLLCYYLRNTVLDYALVGLLPMFIPIVVTLAFYIVWPLEKLICHIYMIRAREKLRHMPKLIRIGITGSYGKTTTKEILAQFLSQKYKVCYTPASFNTPMGICKIVNNELSYEDQVFIAEMGARNPGDIAELARLVEPNYGILTAIGNQHLETFGTREAIIKTKYELIENLATSGLAVFGGDNSENFKLYESAREPKWLIAKEGTAGADTVYKNAKMTKDGAEFDITIAGEDVHIRTRLIGYHIPLLVSICAAIAFQLGVTREEIALAASELKPVAHRLELLTPDNGMVILDDSYNSNTEGADNALSSLADFADRVKIIIAPGFVELGIEQDECNFRLGQRIAAVCDYAILTGPNVSQIKDGAIAGGMDARRILTAQNLDEAVGLLPKIEGEKAVLFENDLPDIY